MGGAGHLDTRPALGRPKKRTPRIENRHSGARRGQLKITRLPPGRRSRMRTTRTYISTAIRQQVPFKP